MEHAMRTRFPQHRQLALLDLFAECTPDQIRAIDHLSTEVAVSPGTQVWHEDRTEPQFIVVVHGEINLTRAGEHIATLRAGAWFGHDALIRGLRSEPFSGLVITPTRLLAFSKREFAALLHAAPAVAATLRHSATSAVPTSHRHDELDAAETGPALLAAHQSNSRAPITTVPRTRSSRHVARQELKQAPASALTEGAVR
jgi:CRP-like cAMP-binding protein